MSESRMKPIWYFVGLMLLIMGGLIFLTGLYQVMHPPPTMTVLAQIHPGIWWGVVMILFGGFLYLKSKKEFRREHHEHN
jgi:FtsH-binding integral membrane protein